MAFKRSGLAEVAYRISLAIKGIDGILELIGGTLFLVIKPATIHSLVIVLTRHELTEEPNDLTANLLRSIAEKLSVNADVLASIYLLAHGVLKVLLVYGLLREKRWIFPIAFVVLGIFVGFEIARLMVTFSGLLLGALLFDLFVLTMVWRHFRRLGY